MGCVILSNNHHKSLPLVGFDGDSQFMDNPSSIIKLGSTTPKLIQPSCIKMYQVYSCLSPCYQC